MKRFDLINKLLQHPDQTRTTMTSHSDRQKKQRKFLPWTLMLFVVVAFAPAFQSCSMVNEDLEPCAPKPNNFVKVNFVYDYNMQQVDLLNDHVGSVYLYVFDKDGVYKFRHSALKADMSPNNIDFSMTFDTTYLPIGNAYKLVAIAQGNHAGYISSLETPGFTLQHEMVPGVSTIEDYRLKLDRDDDGTYDFGIINYKDTYGDNRQMIDTLWSTKPNQVQDLDIPYIEYRPSATQLPDTYQEVTIPLMRITNAVKVNIVHDQFTADTNPDEYNIDIDFPNGNGTIGFTGTTYPVQELWYRALRKTTKQYQQKQNGAQYDAEYPATRAGTTYCIESQFGVSRMQTTDGCSLQIRNARTGVLIAKIDDFAAWLAEYFDHRFDDQEFLDREYDFTVDIHLDDLGNIDWYQIGCSILGWGKRVQLLDF